MATTTQIRIRGRPAHTQGLTYLSYTPDGTKLVTIGSNNLTRVYKTGYDGEPTNIDECSELQMGVDSTNDFFISGADDGTVSKYNFDDMTLDKQIIRSSLPIRDVCISSDGKWCAVASDELVVYIVNPSDPSSVMYIRDLPKPTKHLSFDPSCKYIALSCTDGKVYIYSIVNDAPELVRKIDGLIRTEETDSEISTKIIWHPDGRTFAAPTATRDIQVMSLSDWENQRIFSNGHMGHITALAWSHNGAMLATAGKDSTIILWETKTQRKIATYTYGNVIDLAWHPTKNLLSFTNTEGEVYIYNDFVPPEHAHLVKLGPQPSPFIHDPLSETSANARRPIANGAKDVPLRGVRQETPDGIDDLLPPEIMGEDDDWIVDDDEAGYTAGLNANGKRPNGDVGPYAGPQSKRLAQAWEPQYHESFQPGSTPWRGNRKYLCLNLIGFVWTVDQDDHHTVTVEFYDHEFYRDFHFTDTFLYDKACLNESGTLFSCRADEKQGKLATIFYRPHETWTTRADWRTQLPKGEDVTAISLSDSFVTVTTTANYIRVYTLFGIPYRVYRQKSSPTVSCASWRDYVLTLGNGPVGADGTTKLLYTIQNIKRDEICQSEDIVALPDGETIKSVFFSDNGDPCIYDSTGTLLTLLHWRTPSQASWVPLLDTKLLSRLASGRKTETYFPVAVADNKFHCIILKGGDKYPYFPRPLLSEFDFEIPLSSNSKPDSGDGEEENGNDGDELKKLESAFVLNSILMAQQQDLVDYTKSTHTQRTALARMEIEIDKTLLQMMAVECREGEERGMRALEMVTLLRDRTGRMIEAAGKVAERYGRTVLGDKIREVGEARLINVMDED